MTASPEIDNSSELSQAPESAGLTSKMASSSFISVARRGQYLLTTAVSTVVLTRVFEADGYGRLQNALAGWTIFLSLADFGFTLALSRDLAADGADRAGLLQSAMRVQSWWAALLALVMLGIGLAEGGPGDAQGQLLLILAPSVVVAGLASGRVSFLVLYEARKLAQIDVITNVVQVAAMSAYALAGGTVAGIAAIVSLGSIVNYAWVAHVGQGLLPAATRIESLGRKVLGAALPLGAMSFMSKVYLSIDLAIIGGWVTPLGLGHYAGAVKIAVLLGTAPGLIVGATLPGLSSVIDDRVQLREVMTRVTHWMVVIALPAFVLCTTCGSAVAGIALGEDFRAAGPLVAILAASGGVGILSQLVGMQMIARRRIRTLFIQNVLAAIGNVTGNFLLVPRYGVQAAAWLTLATEVFVCFGSVFALARAGELAFNPAPLWAPLFAAGMSAVVALALKAHPLIGLVAGSLAYCFSVVALRGVPRELVPSRLSWMAART